MKRSIEIVICLALLLLMAHEAGAGAAAASATKASENPRILVILSGAGSVSLKEGVSHPTGFFLSELVTPSRGFVAAGYDLVFANPTGKEAKMDKASDSEQFFASHEDYLQAKAFLRSLKQFRKPTKLSSLNEERLRTFQAIFVPGGHAPMEDLVTDQDMGRILRHFHAAEKPTALICHGPVALLSARDGKEWPYRGYALTVFSNEEETISEQAGNLGGHLKFYPEDALSAAGAVIKNSKVPWKSNAIRDRELITAQNPMSDKLLTELFLKALAEQRQMAK